MMTSKLKVSKENFKRLATVIIVVMMIAVFTWFISNNYFQFVMISGKSMEPTLHEMQICFMKKYDLSPRVGDIVVFKCENISELIVKRVVACPGDLVQITDKRLYVNGKASEDFTLQISYSGIANEPIKLGKDEFFVLGDNVMASKDSRHEEVGLVKKDNILGVLW